MSSHLHVLFEAASGYALFERVEVDEIGQDLDAIQAVVTELPKFGKMVKLKAFAPFKSAAHALENINDVSEGLMHEHLKSFLEMNLLTGKKTGVQLGVSDKNLAGSIKAELGIDCVCSDIVNELIRGIRFHFNKLLSQLKDGDNDRAQLGLGHSYSRAKVKFNVNRSDNMIIQSICLLDQLDKDINTFAMRVREWYGWHFPELIKIVSDNHLYARLVKLIKNKSSLTDASLPSLEDMVGDASKAKQILDAARASMGTDISDIDMLNIQSFADRVIALFEYRANLHSYLLNKMHTIAPNLSALIGEVVGARLISHAGSLTNLSKYPASTVQILGAEKALFRALKTKGNTPKYGLIYHSSFIGRAGTKNKGRVSRFLANKCSIASRIDCFIDNPTSKFGEEMRTQVEERLKFFEDGSVPRKNAEAMKAALDAIANDMDEEPQEKAEVKKDKKRKADDEEEKDSKKKKKSKKDKKDVEMAAPVEEVEQKEESPKKEKKDKKKKEKKDKKEEKEDVEMKTEESPKKEKKEKKDKKEKKEKKKGKN